MRKNKSNGKKPGNIITKKQIFPIKSTLYLRPLIDFWKEHILTDKIQSNLYNPDLVAALDKVPEFNAPIQDNEIVEKHRDLIDLLMTAVFPTAGKDNDIAAALIPFTRETIYSTTKYKTLFKYIQKCNEENKAQDDDRLYLVVMLNAYQKILQRFYDLDLRFDLPWVVPYIDRETGLENNFKIEVDSQFVEIFNLKEIKPLSDEDKIRLHDNLTNLEVWQEIVPIENFEFRGVAIYRATDVTDGELLSQLKYEMSKNDVLKSDKVFDNLQHKIRSLFRLPDLKVGFSGISGNKDLLHDCDYTIGRGLFLGLTREYCPNDFKKSIYGQLIKNCEPIIILDLAKYAEATSIEAKLIENGIKNIALLPLVYDDQLLGLIELATNAPGVINAINTMKLDSLMPLFTMAIRRHLEALNNRIQNIIREEATAIHPTVAWRFRDAAYNKMRQESSQEFVKMEPIVFEDVHSLYGLSDIRGSSTIRNQTIQEDLIDQLNLAKNVILVANRLKNMPIFNDYIFRIEAHQTEISNALNSEEEQKVLEFLHHEVEPLFDHLEQLDEKVKKNIRRYKDALNPDLGFIYNRRKDFEDSVAHVNDVISAYIDSEEEKAQHIFPHYFEKYKTDGVDYNLYVGASLVQHEEYNPIYLKNLRLWQVMLMCGIVRKSAKLKNELKMPLETAHLILVQSNPIAIQFRFDEKRFDVNGAYNVKYEIVKKRIDKAVIAQSGERLTQPGKIAIVYSHLKDAYEYQDYIKYLQHEGILTNDVEDVALEDMQGVQGLRALRISVNTSPGKEQEIEVPKSVEQAIQEMSKSALD